MFFTVIWFIPSIRIASYRIELAVDLPYAELPLPAMVNLLNGGLLLPALARRRPRRLPGTVELLSRNCGTTSRERMLRPPSALSASSRFNARAQRRRFGSISETNMSKSSRRPTIVAVGGSKRYCYVYSCMSLCHPSSQNIVPT